MQDESTEEELLHGSAVAKQGWLSRLFITVAVRLSIWQDVDP